MFCKNRKRILWLASWYPNRNDPFDGDFIQRQARAAALLHDVHVIFVTPAEMDEYKVESWHEATGLTEQLIYFRRQDGPLGKWQRHRRWQKLYLKAIARYIDRNGPPDLIHVQVPFKAGLIALQARKKWKIPFVVSEHWGLYERRGGDDFYSRNVLAQSLLKKIFHTAARVVAVSDYLANGIRQATGRASDAIIPNVVDTTLFFPKEEKYSRFTFLHVSNMAPVKGVDKILEAFRRHLSKGGDAQLVLVGNRDDRYVKQAAAMGLLNASVFFRGEIPYREVAGEMQRSHALVMCSDSETFSCVTAEALCCGLPVISTAAGALPELVNESNGKLVPIGDAEALAAAMGEVRRGNAEAIASAAAARFGYGPVSEQIDALYRSVV